MSAASSALALIWDGRKVISSGKPISNFRGTGAGLKSFSFTIGHDSRARLTLAAYAVGPFLAGVSWWFGRRILARSLASRQADADLTSATQQALATVGLAQTYGREPDEHRRFMGFVQRSVRAFMRLKLQEQLYPLSRDTFLAL